MKPILTVDRIEGNRVIIEFGSEFIELPTAVFTSPPQEGDRLAISIQKRGQNSLTEAEERLKRLKERDSGEDNIDL